MKNPHSIHHYHHNPTPKKPSTAIRIVQLIFLALIILCVVEAIRNYRGIHTLISGWDATRIPPPEPIQRPIATPVPTIIFHEIPSTPFPNVLPTPTIDVPTLPPTPPPEPPATVQANADLTLNCGDGHIVIHPSNGSIEFQNCDPGMSAQEFWWSVAQAFPAAREAMLRGDRP
jgi:hypothetical protein